MSGQGWLGRLRAGLSKSSNRLVDGIASVFTRRKLDDEAIEGLEEVLIAADVGPATAATLAAKIAATRFEKDITPEAVRSALAAEIAAILAPVALPLAIDPAKRPHVVLVIGVNGTGKTTTIGKLAKAMRDDGKRVMLAAGDTFRAAAVEQLKIWGQRSGSPVVARQQGADSAGLAYEALQEARRENADVLLIDTAGRLHNKANLMAELEKVARVLKKLDPDAPQDCLLVLDATTGQNALSQVATFREMLPITGLVVTKLDGSAKGGVLVALAEKFGIPVRAIGIGEGLDDLRPFDATAFARSLMGLDA
jgi:fused signal recognition particle receptor